MAKDDTLDAVTSGVKGKTRKTLPLFCLGRGGAFSHSFCKCTKESILFECITTWCGNCSGQDCKKLQTCEHSSVHHAKQPPPTSPLNHPTLPARHTVGWGARINDVSGQDPASDEIDKFCTGSGGSGPIQYCDVAQHLIFFLGNRNGMKIEFSDFR